MNNAVAYDAKSTYSGVPDYVAYPSANQLFPNATAVGAKLLRDLPAYAAQVASANGNVTKAADIEKFFKIQWDLIFKSHIPVAEVLIEPMGKTLDTEYWGSVPFSRGNVHISSADPTAPATIDPKYFMLDFDFEAQVQAARFIRDLFKTEPFAGLAGEETSPGLSTVSANAKDQEWSSFIKNNCKFMLYRA